MPTDLFGEQSDLPHAPIPGGKTLDDLRRYLQDYDNELRSAKDIEEHEFGKTRSNGKFIFDLWRRFLGEERAKRSHLSQEMIALSERNLRLERCLKRVIDAYDAQPGSGLFTAIEAAKGIMKDA